MPNRTQVYQMCFAMELSVEETQEYLFYGLHEPAFQVIDYQEVLLAYGIYQHCSFSECLDMINELEMLLAETDYTLWCKLHPLLPPSTKIDLSFQ